jgi:hypothetical protein
MLLILPVLILLLSALIILVVRIVRPGFAYSWLIAALGALFTWPLTLLMRLRIPQVFQLATWQPESYFHASPSLLLDQFSWPFVFTLGTLVLAVILTDVARASEGNWSTWASSLGIAALGLIAVMAENPLTLLLAWAAIDIFELLVLLARIGQSSTREQILIMFSARSAGIVLLLVAWIISESNNERLIFTSISPQVNVYLLLAAGLRLGVIPPYRPFRSELVLRRGPGTMLRLVPVSASLVLLARTAGAGVPTGLYPFLLGLTGLTALYSAASWTSAKDELEGRPYWILGGASFAIAAAIRSLPAASLSWGITTVLMGGLIFLFSARHRALIPLSILGLLGISALPFTQNWEGVRLYSPPLNPLLALFLAAHALLMAGYLRHSLREGQQLAGVERWIWLIYPWGLALIPLSQIIITVWAGTSISVQSQSFPPLLQSWPALAVFALFLLITVWRLRRNDRPIQVADSLRRFFNYDWLYRLVWSIYRALGRLIAFINLILEGEGGILWTLLLLTLLLSFLAQFGPGG